MTKYHEKPKHKMSKTLCAAAIGLALHSSYTLAADSVVLEKITVTSQKREQYINDVSIAVTAFSGEQMDALGFESSTDLIAFTPGVSLAGDIGGQRAIFNIRGVVQNDYADIAEAPVAVYVDGGYLASTQAQTFGLFDISRVEILKGPQGTLFGRNATGGMVNTITAKPTEETEGYAEVTFASFEQKRFEGAFSGSLNENVTGRISVMANKMGNILENIYEDGAEPDTRAGTEGGGEDGYNDDTKAVRGQLNFDLGNNANLLLSANWADSTKSEGPYQVINTTEVKDAAGNVVDVIYAADDPLGCDAIQAGVCVDGNFNGDPYRPVQGGDFNGNIDPDGSGELVNKDFAFDDQNKIESKGLAATYDYEFDAFTFTSVTDWKNFTRVIGLDSDQTASPELIFQSDGDITQFSEELRLNGSTMNMKWVAGFYYLNIDTEYLQGLAASPTGGYLAGEEQNTLADITTDSYSVFGQIDYDLDDDLVLVAGLRLVQENKSLDGQLVQNANLDDRVIEVDDTATPLVDVALENDKFMWSAKLQLDYKPNEDTLLYAGVNRGVKAGNFNAPLGGAFSTYDPEVLLAYEAGAKLTLMDGKAQVNSSVFYYDYEDYQSFSWVNNAGVVFNEQAHFTGAEVEILLNPVDALDIMLGASYTDAVVEDLEVASGIFVDTTPPYTPEWQGSALIRYTWSLDIGSIAAQASGSYQSESFHNARNFTAQTIESHFKADARVTWEDTQGLWSVAAYVNNLTDSDHEIIGFDVSGFYGTTQMSYAKPRTYGITVRRNF